MRRGEKKKLWRGPAAKSDFLVLAQAIFYPLEKRSVEFYNVLPI